MPLEEKTMRVIFSKYGIDYDDEEMWKQVKWADEYVFALELRDIKVKDERSLYNLSVKIPEHSGYIENGWSAYQAEDKFLTKFEELL